MGGIKRVFCAPEVLLLMFRIIGEEKLLEHELENYRDYKLKVKYRLIPFVW
jgi:protein-S-isoprenylcysteine O-methyltransferase Ste14